MADGGGLMLCCQGLLARPRVRASASGSARLSARHPLPRRGCKGKQSDWTWPRKGCSRVLRAREMAPPCACDVCITCFFVAFSIWLSCFFQVCCLFFIMRPLRARAVHKGGLCVCVCVFPVCLRRRRRCSPAYVDVLWPIMWPRAVRVPRRKCEMTASEVKGAPRAAAVFSHGVFQVRVKPAVVDWSLGK